MTAQEAAQATFDVRLDPELWFTGWGRVKDLVTQAPIRAKAKPLQRRGWAHYQACQAAGVPCRQVWVKGRRAGGSDGCAVLVYLHANNYQARLGQIGTNYRTAHNMLEKVKFIGEHDDFPGWSLRGGPKVEQRTVTAEDFYGPELANVSWSERTEKVIEAKIAWPHGSAVELYTAENPESARSAGLQGFHWTEFFRAPNGGAKDAGETLNAMVKTVPKRGFTFIALEGTANGAAGAGYELVKTARWDEGQTYWRKWEMMWPQNVAAIGKELQFVLIFAAWFEDCENALECTHAEQEAIRASLDQTERTLIERYQCDGPRGPRLGNEVETTVWNQLKWRRATILYECKQMGAQEFAQEWPSDPEEAFRASGSPALDMEGVRALESMTREGFPGSCDFTPQYGQLSLESNGAVTWRSTEAQQATIARWEAPIETMEGARGCRYLVACDPMSGADQVTGHGEKDRHAVFVLRDAYTSHRGKYQRARVVARIVPPCQWEDEVLARQLYYLSLYYGGATIVVEANQGMAILKALANDYRANVDQREEFDTITQRMTKQLGWWNNAQTRRSAVATLQLYVREQLIEVFCKHAVGELMTFIIDSKGKARASGSNHDDDCFVAGTRILTPGGEVPIEKLRAGDFVITRDGPRPVGRTFSRVKPVIRSRLGLVGTPTHPVITTTGEHPLDSLIASDTLYVWNSLLQKIEKRSFTEAKSITAIRYPSGGNCAFTSGDTTNGNSRPWRCTGRFGSTIAERFRRATSFITGMATRSIMRLRTWSLSAMESTPSSTGETRKCNVLVERTDCDRVKGSYPSWLIGGKITPNARQPSRAPAESEMSSRLWLDSPNGARRRQPKSKTYGTPERRSSSPSEQLNVLNAAKLSSPRIAPESIAPRSVETGSKIEDGASGMTKRRVYNLRIEGTHEYFANGILVHNCMALALALERLPAAHEYPRPPKVQIPDWTAWR